MITDYETRLQMANKQIDDATNELQVEFAAFLQDRETREPDQDDWDDTLLATAQAIRYAATQMKHIRKIFKEGL